MKLRFFFAILLVAAAWAAGRYVTNRSAAESASAGREEISETYTLEPGARVEVRGINGPVNVETSDTTTAEVRIVRTANNASDLQYQKVTVEATGSSLVVRGGGNVRGFWRRLWGGGSVKQEVTLRLPRRVDFEASGVNGAVKVGEVEGAVEMNGVNGRVDVARAGTHAQFSGINGGVGLTVAQLGAGGVDMNGINGGVEFRMTQDVNADIEINGLNGSVSMNLPNVTSQEHTRRKRGRFSARLGTGGPAIDMSGINGSVRFVTYTASN